MCLTIDLSSRGNRTPPRSDDLLLFGPVCSGPAPAPALAEKPLPKLGNSTGGGKGAECEV